MALNFNIKHEQREMPLLRIEALVGFTHRSHRRKMIDEQRRQQKKDLRNRRTALVVLADPIADQTAKDAAHRVLDAHRNRITALERTHGRAINREVIREQRRAGRIGSPITTTMKAATLAKPFVPNCKHQRAVLEIKIPDVLPPNK